MIYKRATTKLRNVGLAHLQVVKGCYGPYLYDTRFDSQSSYVMGSPEECVQAAIRGEVPHQRRDVTRQKRAK